jgi:hypothetical protein
MVWQPPVNALRSPIAWLCALVTGAALVVASQALPAPAAANVPVVVIVMENHSFGPNDQGVDGDRAKYVVGNPEAPYINDTLIPSGTLFTHYTAYAPASLPNYLVMTSGTAEGCPQSPCEPATDRSENLFHRLGQEGTPFASLMESMPDNCALVDSGRYDVAHNPEVYYTNVAAGTGLPYRCPMTDLPVAAQPSGTPDHWPDPLPAFSFIAPDDCDNMHGADGTCPNGPDQLVADGDAWLAANVPVLLERGAIVLVTFDEGSNNDLAGGGGHIMTVMVGAGVPAGRQDPTHLTHFGLLGGLMDYFDLAPLLARSATATPLVIPRATPYVTPSISGMDPVAGPAGSTVTLTGSGFMNAYAVTFGGVKARFTIASDTSILATVPAGEVDGRIQVRTAGGVATSAEAFGTSSGPTPTAIRSSIASGPRASKATAAWPQPTDDGDLLVAIVAWSGDGAPGTPTGWDRAATTGRIAAFYREGAPSQTSVSIPFSADVGWTVSLSEWRGVAASDALGDVGKATSGSDVDTTAALGAATADTGDLTLAAIRVVGDASPSDPTNGFGFLDASAMPNATLHVYDGTVDAAGHVSASFSLSSPSKWQGLVLTFDAG